jgi:hypothetical protein
LDHPVKRIPWKDVDVEKYKELTQCYLSDLASDIPEKTTTTVEKINQALYKASREALTTELPPAGKPRNPRARPWNPALKPTLTAARKSYMIWKQAGGPSSESPEWQNWKADKRALRREQRQSHARSRKAKHQEIMDAAHEDQSLFHKLVKKQRSTGNQESSGLEFDGAILPDEEAVSAWADYFEELATPKEDPAYEEDHRKSMNTMFNSLQKMYESRTIGSILPKVTVNQIEKLISALKTNKAADMYGITSEHFKCSHPILESILVDLFNKVVKEKSIPNQFKHGVIVPVPKPKKSAKNPDNYRRITITSTVGKLFEKVIVAATKPVLDDKLNRLQRGFCPNTSSTNTAFMISEAIAKDKDCKQTMLTIFLDASKAFDVVFHASRYSRFRNYRGPMATLLRIIRRYDQPGQLGQSSFKNKYGVTRSPPGRHPVN